MSNEKQWLSGSNSKHIVPKMIKGVPTYVEAETDFGMQDGHDADSQFVAAELKSSDGREFGLMLHIMCMNSDKANKSGYPIALSIISMTDFTRNTYCSKEDSFTEAEFTHKKGEDMDVTTPVSYLRGNKKHVEMESELPDGLGKITLVMDQDAPVLYNCATGKFPFFGKGGESGQFSLPYLQAKGTLLLNGEKLEVSGNAWLDREWVDTSSVFYDRNFKWKWMNLQLDNGYRISLWDIVVHDGEEYAWATILSPKGAHMVVDMEPLEKGEGDFFTGKTGQIYPTSYHIEFPSIDSYFDVKVRGLLEQEIVSPMGEDKYEAACTFTGKFLGEDTAGTNYVELVGSFK
ncbi:MAG: lipocalin-like domain-containing protein [Candidatus Ornithomonoglobus sp.]